MEIIDARIEYSNGWSVLGGRCRFSNFTDGCIEQGLHVFINNRRSINNTDCGKI